MGHGNNTRGYEGDGSPRDAAGMATGASEEGPVRWKRAIVGAAQGVASVNPPQPGAAGAPVNAATQIATALINRQTADNDGTTSAQKLPAWYLIQRQREEQAKIRPAPRTLPAL